MNFEEFEDVLDDFVYENYAWNGECFEYRNKIQTMLDRKRKFYEKIIEKEKII